MLPTPGGLCADLIREGGDGGPQGHGHGWEPCGNGGPWQGHGQWGKQINVLKVGSSLLADGANMSLDPKQMQA